MRMKNFMKIKIPVRLQGAVEPIVVVVKCLLS
jgi:hypothetical protein